VSSIAIQSILEKHPGARRDSLIPILQEVQEKDGYLSREAIVRVGAHLGLPASKIFGVATFYNQFRFQPHGRFHIQVCRGTACHVKGSARVLDAFEQALERPELRREVTAFGVSQIDAGSRIELGGYTEAGDAQSMTREQFTLGDIRPLDEVMRELLQDGYIPSFCTACYRLGRTGKHFMEFAIPGFIKRFCTPNALSTLTEYLLDYASEETREIGEKLVAEELTKMEDEKIKPELVKRLRRIQESDERDLYF
jgi:hypothetical protein